MNVARELIAVAKMLAGLDVGKTIENDSVRIHRYRPSVTVTDLTNAGKRGKRCEEFTVYNLDWATKDAVSEIENMMDDLSRVKNYGQAMRVMEKGVEAINAATKYLVETDSRLLRGVDVAPGGFSPIEIHGRYVHISADFDSFSVRDLEDRFNEPTCIPTGSGKKTAVKMFYRWATDNENWIKGAKFEEVLNSMTKAGIPYHYYCAVD